MSRQLNIQDIPLPDSGSALSALSDLSPRRGVKLRRTIRGCDGEVEIDEAIQAVTKTYRHPNHETAVRNAKREVAYASRLREALAAIKGVACPRVFAWELSAPPRIVMELCPGKELTDFLLEIDGRDNRLKEIAARIQDGLEVYTTLFQEPYYDCCFNNMLFDEGSATLTFLDFVIPARPENVGPDSPLEASLGWLIGCACYTLARPAFLLSSRSAHLGLIQALMSRFEGKVSTDRVYAYARSVFSQMCGSGGRLRRNYYRTIGALVGASCLFRLYRQSTAG